MHSLSFAQDKAWSLHVCQCLESVQEDDGCACVTWLSAITISLLCIPMTHDHLENGYCPVSSDVVESGLSTHRASVKRR